MSIDYGMFWFIKLGIKQTKINTPISLITQNKKRILFVSAADWAFRIHRLSLAKWLIEQGFKVAVICPSGNTVEELKKSGLEVYHMPLTREYISLREISAASKSIVRSIENFNPDIIHCVSLRCILLCWYATRTKPASPCLVNHVIGMGSIFSEEPRSIKTRIIRGMVDWGLKKAFRKPGATTVFQNYDDLRWWKKRVGLQSNQMLCIPGGIDWHHDNFEDAPHERRILFVGRMLRDKGILELIDAWSQLLKEGIFSELYFCGSIDPGNPNSFSKTEMETLAEKRGFKWLGRRTDIPKQMARASLVVLPTYREGFPRVLLEAGMANRAVIATDVPGCREIVENEKTGLLVKPREVRSLFLGMKRLLNDPSLRERLARGLHQRVKTEFSDLVVNPKWKNLYDNIIRA